MSHLWEAKHAYYCSPQNYYDNNASVTYSDWADFKESEWFTEADLDSELLFRWDWNDDMLFLFFMGQRKGVFQACVIANMKADDEAEVRLWLAPRWLHLWSLWAPLTPP